jgi:hypothetical protein
MRVSINKAGRSLVVLGLSAVLLSTYATAADKYKIDKMNGGKLYTMTAKIDVLSEPKMGVKKLATYEPGAMMAVIVEAKGTDFLYVSPCNACDKGLVPKAEFMSKVKQ